MNPDNPYAAPQTIGFQPPAVALSAETERLRFTEFSTERLRQLLDYSYAIQQMHVMWILLATAVAGWFVLTLLIALEHPIGELVIAVSLVVAVLTLLRVAAGYYREKLTRGFSMSCDGLLIIGCLWLLVFFLRDGSLALPVICVFVGFHAASSFLAHHHARELFGSRPINQEELAGEVAYRQQYGIA